MNQCEVCIIKLAQCGSDLLIHVLLAYTRSRTLIYRFIRRKLTGVAVSPTLNLEMHKECGIYTPPLLQKGYFMLLWEVGVTANGRVWLSEAFPGNRFCFH